MQMEFGRTRWQWRDLGAWDKDAGSSGGLSFLFSNRHGFGVLSFFTFTKNVCTNIGLPAPSRNEAASGDTPRRGCPQISKFLDGGEPNPGSPTRLHAHSTVCGPGVETALLEESSRFGTDVFELLLF